MMVLVMWLWVIVWLLLVVSVVMTVVVAAAVVRRVSTATCGIINVTVGNNVAIAVFIKVNVIATATDGHASTNATGHIHW